MANLLIEVKQLNIKTRISNSNSSSYSDGKIHISLYPNAEAMTMVRKLGMIFSK